MNLKIVVKILIGLTIKYLVGDKVQFVLFLVQTTVIDLYCKFGVC